MTEPTPDVPPNPDPEPTDPIPEPEEPPTDPGPGDDPGICGAVHPTYPHITCPLRADHFAYRLVHSATVDGSPYEWE